MKEAEQQHGILFVLFSVLRKSNYILQHQINIRYVCGPNYSLSGRLKSMWLNGYRRARSHISIIIFSWIIIIIKKRATKDKPWLLAMVKLLHYDLVVTHFSYKK